ncbi:MAG: glycosyltransferase family 2 protein [Desulfuromonadaceae bacterium]|nr:glycosyltransferase family 2 protein [Desulfuromonadaceae bacterium]
MKVSVIILTWNGQAYLKECLDSLAAQTFRGFETILVDNGSSDGSAEYVRSTYPWVRLLELPENAGFAEGNNRGLALAHGVYIVTLNNDTKVDPEFLAELIRVADGNACVGMVAARMRNYYRPERVDAAGLKIGCNGLGYNIGIGEVDDGRYDSEPLFGPCGGAALYRREMLDEIGFFDPDFFAYYEDVDLAWRARLAGWKALAAPRALVYHVHSATGGEMSRFKVYYTQRNKWFVILKNWPAALFWRKLVSILCADLGALCLAVLRGRGTAAVRARIDALRSLSRLLQKRREVQGRRKLSDRQVALLFSPHEHLFLTFLRKMGLRHND